MKIRIYTFILVIVMLMNTPVVGTYSENTPIPFDSVQQEETEKSRVETILDSMSIRDKITQMMMVDIQKWNGSNFTVMNDTVYQMLSDFRFGAVILFAGNVSKTEQTYHLTQAMQKATLEGGGLPLFIAADQEGGIVYRLGSGTALPGNMALGATGNTQYAETAGNILGSELSTLGINTNLSPVVDVNSNPNNPVIGLRSFGSNATSVGNFASSVIAGMAKHNVVGCAKHFPGHGDTATDSHYGLPSVNKSKQVLLENELKPFQVAIDNGIEMIMTAHILYPQLDGSTVYSEKTGVEESLTAPLSKVIVTDLLKTEMGFDGIVITDAMNMAALADHWTSLQAAILAINAGVDMLCMPCSILNTTTIENMEALVSGLVTAVEEGTIPMARINDAVARILSVKEKRGILDYAGEDLSLDRALSTVGCKANRDAEREIAAAAVTVVKNNNNVLPLRLDYGSKVLMLCPYANEQALMLMGWNRAKVAQVIPPSATVDYYQYTSSTLNSTIKQKIEQADVVIVLSEVTSAARMAYDHWTSTAPYRITNYAKENGKISVVISADKPYDVQMYPNADAIMAVYGCKGTAMSAATVLANTLTAYEAASGPNIAAGVEVAFGVLGAKGTLPVDIPRFNNSNNTYSITDFVYKRGYGLSYDMAAKYEIDPCDVNQDGYINISDVNDLLSYLAGADDTLAKAPDVTSNGVVNVDDLNTLLIKLSTLE